MKKVFNVGIFRYIGIKTRSDVYNSWYSMLRRCYCKTSLEKDIQYKGINVVDEWLDFQNFVDWYYVNFNPDFMQGWQLDKDILVKGNKIYSPETCCFVPQEINKLFTKRQNKRGDYPIGVSKRGTNTYRAQISKMGHRFKLGNYTTPEEAFQVYKTAKEDYIKEVAEKWRDYITDEVYQAMYNYKVEITD